MQVEKSPIDRPIPYARNARKIPQAAIDKVASSIKEFGWRQPIVVDPENVIIVGHTRLLAAQKLALSEVPVHVAHGLTPAQVKAYRLMDNRSHDEASWDLELLGPELAELQGLDLALECYPRRAASSIQRSGLFTRTGCIARCPPKHSRSTDSIATGSSSMSCTRSRAANCGTF
jgi:ParB-like chromosome segregation protein Spo0J